MHALRSIVAFVVPAMAGIVILLFLAPAGRDRARNLATRVVGRLGCALAGIRLRVRDPEHLSQRRPAVFVFNHQSGVDPVVLCALLRRDVVGVAKHELRRHPLLGPLLGLAGTVFVERGAGRGSAMLAPARSALEKGLAVAIAPEGHRNRSLGKLRSGAVHLTTETGVPLIPVVIHDSASVLPPGKLLMRPGIIHVEVLPALTGHERTTEKLESLFHEHLVSGRPHGTARYR